MAKKLTQEEFIARARSVHGDKYDYSKCEYKNSRSKVVVICKIHGEFKQEANAHMSSHGCPKCGSSAPKGLRKTTEQFIRECELKHGFRYDYSKSVYNGAFSKVEILCRKHGSFYQTPSNHLNGSNCPKCTIEWCDTEQFTVQAKSVHGDKYNYDLVKYKNSTTKVTIGCPDHGHFDQVPSNHLSGQGCPKCTKNKKLTTSEFIEEARAVHGDRYDYSLVEYSSTKSNVTIICKEHGKFKQSPYYHKLGGGCRKCNKSGSFDENKMSKFYIYTGDFVGFGISTDFESRNKKHLANAKRRGANIKVHSTYDMIGHLAKNLELNVKRFFKGFIYDTGVPGFKTEALPKDCLRYLIKFVEAHTIRFLNMDKMKLFAVYTAAKDLLKVIAAQQDPSDALERLKRAVDDVGYANDKEENA